MRVGQQSGKAANKTPAGQPILGSLGGRHFWEWQTHRRERSPDCQRTSRLTPGQLVPLVANHQVSVDRRVGRWLPPCKKISLTTVHRTRARIGRRTKKRRHFSTCTALCAGVLLIGEVLSQGIAGPSRRSCDLPVGCHTLGNQICSSEPARRFGSISSAAIRDTVGGYFSRGLAASRPAMGSHLSQRPSGECRLSRGTRFAPAAPPLHSRPRPEPAPVSAQE